MASTSDTLAYGGVETFNSLSSGVQNVTTDFGTGGSVTGTYTDVSVVPADQYGGAGGTGMYAEATFNTSYSLALSTTAATGINYFGAFVTSLDVANTVQFYNGNTLVGDLQLSALLPASVTGNSAYDYNTAYYNINIGQPFVFINFLDTTGTFNKVVFSEPSSYEYGGSFESDNHTVGFIAQGVPEPASWALMILGTGLIGGLARRRRGAAITA